MLLVAKHVESPYIIWTNMYSLLLCPFLNNSTFSIFENYLIELSNSINNNMKNIIQSVCNHGIVSGHCALCSLSGRFRLQAISDCTHNLTYLTVKHQDIGMLCDFRILPTPSQSTRNIYIYSNN